MVPRNHSLPTLCYTVYTLIIITKLKPDWAACSTSFTSSTTEIVRHHTTSDENKKIKTETHLQTAEEIRNIRSRVLRDTFSSIRAVFKFNFFILNFKICNWRYCNICSFLFFKLISSPMTFNYAITLNCEIDNW